MAPERDHLGQRKRKSGLRGANAASIYRLTGRVLLRAVLQFSSIGLAA